MLKRQRISSSVDPDLWQKVQDISKKTRIPVSKLLDEALEYLVKKYER